MIEAHAFRAMGTDVELFVRSSNGGATEAFDAVEAEFERLEQIMSRFRPDSELSQLNRAGALEVSAELAHVIELALAARERDGRPVRSLRPRCARRRGLRPHVRGGRSGRSRHGAGRAGLRRRSIGRRPPRRARRRSEARSRRDRQGLCRRARGRHPRCRRTLSRRRRRRRRRSRRTLLAGRRRDRRGIRHSRARARRTRHVGQRPPPLDTRRRGRHHLIDPRTGRSADSDLLRVTAFADDAVQAEVLAKLLFLAGADEAAESGATAILVTRSGETIFTGGFA